MKEIKVKDYKEIPINYTGMVAYPNGTKEWLQNGKLHREDGPAVVYINGHKEWWLNNKQHNENGPAIVFADGTKYWYKNGELHNENGPAMVFADGRTYWFLDGEGVTKLEFKLKTNKLLKGLSKLLKVLDKKK